MMSTGSILKIACLAFLVLPSPAKAENASRGGADSTQQAVPKVELTAQMGHPSLVKAVAFSPDSRFAVSGSGDKTLKLWDISSGKLLRTFTGHTGGIQSVVFSPDGRLLLSGSDDATMKLWELATGRELRSFAVQKHTIVNSVAFSPDGHFALSASHTSSNSMEGGTYKRTVKGVITLWEVATGKALRALEGHRYPVTSVAFSADGRFVLSGSSPDTTNVETVDPASGETMKLWEIASGKELRSFVVSGDGVDAVAFSPDGRLALSGGKDQTMRLWDVATGKELRSFAGHSGRVTSVAFSPDGRFALSGNSYDRLMSPDRRIGLSNAGNTKLWDVNTGQEVRSFVVPTETITNVAGRIINNPTHVAFSPDGRFVLSDNGGSMALWDAATGRELRYFVGHSYHVTAVAFSPDGRLALIESGRAIKLWDLANGKQLRSFGQNSWGVAVAFSPDSRIIASGTHGDFEKRMMDGPARSAVAFSPDGRSVLSAGGWKVALWDASTGEKLREFGEASRADKSDNPLKLWDAQTGKELRRFSGHGDWVTSVAFSPDGRFALSGSRDKTMRLWDVATGKELRQFDVKGSDWLHQGVEVAFSPDGRVAASGRSGEAVLWEIATGNQLYGVGLPGLSKTMAFSADGRLLLLDGDDNTIRLIDIVERTELRVLTGHKDRINSVAFSPDRRLAISGSIDGTARIWDLQEGRELARLMSAPFDEWLALTPHGFFSSASRDTDMLGIVRGLEVTTIGQIHQSLFNPDLVREALAGDTGGEVARAARIVNLEKVLESGPAPSVQITSHAPGSRSNSDLITVATRITDRGKGIGRIEWRVNGVTAGVTGTPSGSGPDFDLQRTLALDPGTNQIEVIAYEGRDLLASLPGRTTVIFDGSADGVKPNLHILAIGINAYNDKGGTPSGKFGQFLPLNLAVADARAFAAAMQKAGAGLYSEIRITEAFDADAAAAGLDRIVERMSAKINPRDTFVLFAAAHGISNNGRFYLIPQDYQGGNDPEALASRAIGQERLQEWVANRIKAKKAIILLDTCESGALVSGHTKSRVDAPASEAAIGRLHEATGRPVLTAAASGKPAFEGYKGHGVFTFALMDALHRGDSSGNGVIELSELVAHVQSLVPKLSAELNGRGVSTIAIRGFKNDAQSAHFGSTGEDFALVRRLP